MFGLWQEVTDAVWADKNEWIFVYLSSSQYGAVARYKGDPDYELSPWPDEEPWKNKDTIKQIGPQALGEWND